MRRVWVVSVFVCWRFIGRVDFKEQGTENREQGVGSKERGTGNREQGASVLCNLYSVISIVSAPTATGIKRSSMRSIWVVVIGFCVPHDNIRSREQVARSRNFSFIVFYVLFFRHNDRRTYCGRSSRTSLLFYIYLATPHGVSDYYTNLMQII